MSEITYPLGLSIAGHAICLALLILLLPTRMPPAPEPLATGGIEVVFAPLPRPEQPPTQMEPPPLPVETPPPEPEPLPPPPAAEAPAPVVVPPPPRKLAVRPIPKPVHPRPERAQPSPVAAPTQPAPVPSSEISPGYRALLSAWLERHKRYPDSARQRGEEGQAVLRFVIDRNGRVGDFAIARSSGYPDLDASIEEMMRGAVLPPFPESMTQPRIDVSVTVRFSLAR